MRRIEEPITTDEPGAGALREKVTRHPAFGQIVAHRVSGNASLYGSDFRHNGYMVVTIRRSQLRRTLSRDWHYGESELIEVALSEAQWATFVSAPNIGMGVPCTIQHIQHDPMPGLPDPASRADQFGDEIKHKLAASIAEVERTLKEIDGLGVAKGKTAQIKGGLEHLLMELRSNLPFVAEQFGEHMETTVETAKAEIHGYMTAAIHRAGLDALTGGRLPLQIEVANRKEGE